MAIDNLGFFLYTSEVQKNTVAELRDLFGKVQRYKGCPNDTTAPGYSGSSGYFRNGISEAPVWGSF
jgi:hypothetical protein